METTFVLINSPNHGNCELLVAQIIKLWDSLHPNAETRFLIDLESPIKELKNAYTDTFFQSSILELKVKNILETQLPDYESVYLAQCLEKVNKINPSLVIVYNVRYLQCFETLKSKNCMIFTYDIGLNSRKSVLKTEAQSLNDDEMNEILRPSCSIDGLNLDDKKSYSALAAYVLSLIL